MAARDTTKSPLTAESSEEEGSQAESPDISIRTKRKGKTSEDRRESSPDLNNLTERLMAAQVTQRKGPVRKAKSPEKETPEDGVLDPAEGSPSTEPKKSKVKAGPSPTVETAKVSGSGPAKPVRITRTPVSRKAGGFPGQSKVSRRTGHLNRACHCRPSAGPEVGTAWQRKPMPRGGSSASARGSVDRVAG